ncbi:MAG: hypothetical protein R3Y46_04835 [Opitutales bacterium]
MKKLILILFILCSLSLHAKEKLNPEKDKANASLDVSNPDERPYIESQDGSVRLYEDKINLWNSACEFYELALVEFDAKKYDDALYLIEEAIKYAPEEIYEKWSMYMLKGDILRFAGKYEEARKAYMKISTETDYIGIRHAQAIYKIGLSFYDEKEWHKAHPYFERVYVAYFKMEYYASRAYYYDAKCFIHLDKKDISLRILREFFLVMKQKDTPIYLQAQALNRELLDI